MNLLFWIIYLLRLPWYVMTLLLFRLYLLLIFLTRDAAPWLATTAYGLGAWWGRAWLAPLAESQHAAWRSGQGGELGRQLAQLIEADPYLAMTAASGLMLLLTLRWLKSPLRHVLIALPIPERPLPPLRHWSPPRHRLNAYHVSYAMPPLPLRYFDGRIDTLARRLDPRVRDLIGKATPPDKVGTEVEDLQYEEETKTKTASTKRKKAYSRPKAIEKAPERKKAVAAE